MRSESFWRVWWDHREGWVGKQVTEYEDGVVHAGSLTIFGGEPNDLKQGRYNARPNIDIERAKQGKPPLPW